MLVVGEKERAAGSVAVRKHTRGDIGVTPLPSFIESVKKEIYEKSII
jgi:threonyl-tRNA synthetase